jgi:hypothetical protein
MLLYIGWHSHKAICGFTAMLAVSMLTQASCLSNTDPNIRQLWSHATARLFHVKETTKKNPATILYAPDEPRKPACPLDM